MNFNKSELEEYRLSNPMDYIKAVTLLIASMNKNEVFQTIYKITRLHIPDKLYKYYSLNDDENLNDLKLTTLSDEKIFLANSQDFNDPFDNKAFYYRNEELLQFEELRKFEGRIFDEVMFSSRATSLTNVGFNSMPMWAHYSNNHRGFCVSYNMRELRNTELSACTFPIQYLDKRIDITHIMVSFIDQVLKEKQKQISEGKKEIVIDDLIMVYLTAFLQNIKESAWKYEQEFRCAAGETSIGLPFIKAVPLEIYAGEKCAPLHIERLCNIAFQLNIPLYKMEFREVNSDFRMAPVRIC